MIVRETPASTVSTLELTEPRVVRFLDLVPGWHEAPHSDQAGFFRWLSTYVGGPPGHLHEHPASGLVGGHSVMGIMGLPVGQRQYGLHRHTTTEIYLILRGHVESIEGEGQRQRLGPMDVLFIPEQSPHCVRTVGNEDVLLMYVHDEHEPLGASRYVPDDDPSLDDPDPHPSVIRWDDLDPSWAAPHATEAGNLRWSVSWVGGSDTRLNLNPDKAARHDRVALGATVITAANSAGPESWDTVRCLQVADGRVVVDGRPELGVIEPLDVLVVPHGYPHRLRAVGLEGATIIWWHEDNVLPTTAASG
jgi:mannose-6-phosphate isomerase-like protein (cupin superfamily)